MPHLVPDVDHLPIHVLLAHSCSGDYPSGLQLSAAAHLPFLEDQPFRHGLERVVLAGDPVADEADQPEGPGPESVHRLEREELAVLRPRRTSVDEHVLEGGGTARNSTMHCELHALVECTDIGGMH